VVQQLLERGAVVDRRATDGTTALMLASPRGSRRSSAHCRTRRRDCSQAGVKARQLAFDRGYTDIVTLLDRAETLGGRLLLAAVEGNDTVVRQLLATGAPANVITREPRQPHDRGAQRRSRHAAALVEALTRPSGIAR
jgi:ankyrin repeat protein